MSSDHSYSASTISSLEDLPQLFRPFTRDSLQAIYQRREEDEIRKADGLQKEKENDSDSEEEGPQPNPKMEQGVALPIRLAHNFREEYANVPFEDFDPYYENIPTFVIVTKNQDIFRFSATDACFCLSPFNPVRRVAIAILTHGLFSFFIITTILTNCYVMIQPDSPVVDSTEVIFTAIYTFESAVKVFARGFVLAEFTYLRDAWNWLDFVVVGLAYVSIFIDLSDLAALRTCRVFRALKTVAIVPGLKKIVGAVGASVINLRDVIILTVFALSVFGLIGLQIYMGVLTQKCVADWPDDGSEGPERDEAWEIWSRNFTNWWPYPPPDEYGGADYPLCGNSSGAGGCPDNFTCLQGYGLNPNYGYTSFDSFGNAFLSSFRLMTQDFWESLYQQILRTAGPWHMLFFIVVIFLGSYYLVNLILAIVAMSYDELEKKAEEDKMLDDAERENIKQEEEARAKKIAALEARAAAAAAASSSGDVSGAEDLEEEAPGNDPEPQPEQPPLKSPSGYSTRSFEAYTGEGECNLCYTGSHSHLAPGTEANQTASLSLPGSPYNNRRASQAYSRGKLMILTSYVDAQKHLPYADDSTAATPMSEENGAIILPFCNGLHYNHTIPNFALSSRHSSYNSHASRLSYTSHDNMLQGGRYVGFGTQPVTKESQLIERAKHLYLQGIANDISVSDEEKPEKDPKTVGFASPPREELRDPIAETIQTGGQPLEEEPEEEPLTLKEKIKALLIHYLFRCIDIFCLWDCGFPYSYIKKWTHFIVFDAFTELFITLAIVVNVVFMALDHYGLEEKPMMNAMLSTGNYVFTVIFTLESSMKVVAMSPKFFFQVGWNCFDFVIVMVSLIEVVFEDANLPGLSALRSFRLLRVFKLAKSWPALNMILTIMGQTVGSLSNLVVVLMIIIFIFAVMGMQLFAPDYYANTHLFPGGDMPRWNFTDFTHSFLIVFRVLCGEWIESMWDCMLVSGGACVPFFLATVVIGNLVLLNLFLALLLSSFGASSMAPPGDEEPNKLAEAFDRIGRFRNWVKQSIINGFKYLGQLIYQLKLRVIPGAAAKAAAEAAEKAAAEAAAAARRKRRLRMAKAAKLVLNTQRALKKPEQAEDEPEPEDEIYEDDEYLDEDDGASSDDFLKGEEEEGPRDCCPPGFYEKFPIFDVEDTPFGEQWANIRLKASKLIEDKYFETILITMILVSSGALAMEDVNLPNNPFLTDFLFHMDRIFTVIFFFEMILKWVALGFRAYFSNSWCWLDFVIVMVSVINLGAALAGFGSVQAFKTMKTLRALRPLKAMSKMEGMRIVVNALVGSIPAIVNVLLVCLIFWLIFAIMGVQLFSGKFQKCLDPEDESRPDYRIIRNKHECLINNFTWENSVMNFDHVGKAYLSLFQIATFKGWIDIMNDAIDSREIDEQPHREVSFAMYGYFVIFIIFGSFFTLNMFVGVIIDNFNEQKKQSGGSMEQFMTDDQKAYYAAVQKMQTKKPIKAKPKPTWKPQLMVFNFVSNQTFDMVIMLFIGGNMILMMMDHFHMSEAWEYWLGAVNSVFVAVFTAECFLKMFALRQHFFVEPWNLFDLVVVFMSVAGMMLSDLIEKYFVSPTLLRVVRVAKVGRVLRLVKGAKGIRTLLFSLTMSMPALFNICLLLFLVMFIFSIFGMGFFMNVKLRGALDEVYNFQTFGQSIILLFQMSTSAGWDGVLSGIMDETDCDDPDPDLGISGDCGNATVAIAFLLSYLVMSFLVIINMYVAVILENYSQATEDVQDGLTDDDYDMYYEVWAQFDPDGTQYIKYEELSDLLDLLEAPLQIHKPNKFKIISMDIPICKGDMVYCVDILDALTKNFFAKKWKTLDVAAMEIPDAGVPGDRVGYEPVSSTLWRQREEYCARLIQAAWRRHKSQSVQGGLGREESLNSQVIVDEDGGHKVLIQHKIHQISSHDISNV